MAFETVRDVLEFLRQFHRDLARVLESAGGHVAEERKRILLNFVRRHQENMEACLAECEEEAGADIVNTWIKYVPQAPECRCFEKISWTADMPLEDLVARVREVDGCLLKLYSQLADKAPTPEIQELFNSLLEKERNESTRTLRDALSFFAQN